jgi:hypothetical protein
VAEQETPRRRWGRELLGLLASVALVLVAYHSVIFGGKTFDTSSLVAGVNGSPALNIVDGYRPDRGAGAWQMTPWAQVTHRQYAQGMWPLWNPYEGLGEPLAGNAQSAVFDPLLLPVDLHPTTRTWDLTMVFAFILGSLATYWFLRNLGIGILGAVTGAGAFTMSGFFAMNAGDDVVHLYVYLPTLVLTIDRVARTGKLRWVGAMGVAVAGSIVAGMPESTFLVLVAAGAYALYRIASSPMSARWSTAFHLAWAALFGLALATPLVVLLLQFLPLSFNVHGTMIGARTGATGALLYWVIPFFNGYPTIPRVGGFQTDRGWSGAAVATLAVVAASAPRAMRRVGGWFFLVLAVVFLAKNHNVRFFQWIGKLPGFDRSDTIAFAPPLIGLGLAVVAAIGIHALATGEIRSRRLVLSTAVFGVLLAVLLIPNRPVLAVAHDAFARRNYAIAIGAGAAVLAAAFAVALFRRLSWLRAVAPAVAAIALLVELYTLFPQDNYAPRSDPYRPPPWLAMISSSSADPSRVFAFDDLLYPNTAGVLGLQDVRTLNGLYVARYANYLKGFVFPFVDRFTGTGVTLEAVQDNPMFDLLGVRYVMTSTKELDTSGGAGQYTFVGETAGVKVYENGHRAPRAFVVQDVHQVGGMRDALRYLTSLGHAMPDGTTHVDLFDPKRQAVIETPTGARLNLPAGPTDPPGPERPARIVSYGAERVEVDVPAGGPGLVVLADTYFPGWKATVNGRPAQVLATDVTFRGVLLGSEASDVVFTYHSPGGKLGWGIPLLAVVCLASTGLARRFRWQHPGIEASEVGVTGT